MWQKIFQVLCLYVLVVFKMFPCRTTWHWVFMRQVTYSPDWESSLLLWNLRICHYDENLYRCTTYLVSFHSFWWLLPLQNGLLICQMIQWPSMDKLLWYYVLYFLSFLILQMSRNVVTASVWYNFVLFLWSYTVQQFSQLMWLYHEVQSYIHIVKFFQGSMCPCVPFPLFYRFLVYNVHLTSFLCLWYFKIDTVDYVSM